MDVPIGTTLDGQAVGFDTRGCRTLLLVGDSGRGKTTIARYLTRWWLADTNRHAHVYAPAVHEWADLTVTREPFDRHLGTKGRCCPASCLVVVDDFDACGRFDAEWLPTQPTTSHTVITAVGGATLDSTTELGTDVVCLGLVRLTLPNTVETAVLEGQGRLDWPPTAAVVIPDQRGPIDFPCHRWAARATEWTDASR